MDITIQQAIETFCNELRNDKEYYNGWKANIAMSFHDNMSKYEHTIVGSDLHSVANEAANNFLSLLTYVPETE